MSDMPRRDEFILVVDDDEDLRGLLTEVVTRNFPTHTVIECASGTDALREAQLAQKAGRELALAITDEVMPGLRGIDLMEALAHIFPDA
ncbi:MAG: response regulator, partial [Myxococcota bacterium]|nr:response regulator [Myxococcota bacterium]